MSQAGNQLVYFDTYPEMKAKALSIARAQVQDIKQMCEQNNIQLIVVLLPTKLDFDAQARRVAGKTLRLTRQRVGRQSGPEEIAG